MSLAKAAELNGYPGPAHVIEMAAQLRLTADQLQQITIIRERMSAGAKPLGVDIIDHERALDQLFAQGQITPAALTSETGTIGELQGRLRLVHLAAHLETRALLSSDQVVLYQKLRGYDEPAAPTHHHRG